MWEEANEEGSQMHIDTKVNGKSAELFLNGWLDTENNPVLARALADLAPDVENLVIDCTGLEYISSAGIRQFVAAHRKMRGAMTLRHPSEEIVGVLHLMGLDKRLNIER